MKNKKVLITGIIGLVIALIFGSIYLFKSKPTVSVYNIATMKMDGRFLDYNSGNYGIVKSSGLQSVYPSETLRLKELLVSEGQEVKAGDVLLTYDSTLTQLNLDKISIQIQKLKLEKQKLQEEYDRAVANAPVKQDFFKSAYASEVTETPSQQPGEPPQQDHPEKPEINYINEDNLPYPQFEYHKEDGSKEKPFVFTYEHGDHLNNEFLSHYYEEFMRLTGQEGPFYMIIKFSDGSSNSSLLKKDTVEDKVFYSLADVTQTGPNSQPDPQPNPGPDDSEPNPEPFPNPGPQPRTKTEILKEIRKVEFDIRQQELDLIAKRNEMAHNEIKANFDGVITQMKDWNQAISEKTPVFKVSTGTSGYYISSSVDEYTKEILQLDQEVTIMNYFNGEELVGKLTEIGDTPIINNEYGMTNPHAVASQYPIKISLDSTSNLQEDYGVEVKLNTLGQASTYYIPLAFVGNDKNQYYVLKEVDGHLVKHPIEVGKIAAGNYIEIISGLSDEDNVAFIYGKHVVEGAKTKLGDISEMFEGGFGNVGEY